MLAPIAWRTPPEHYGPWESITSLLTEGLVARGVDVTLFATLNSVTAAVLDGVCPHGYAEDAGLDGRVWEALHVSHALARSGEFDLVHNHLDWLPLAFGDHGRAPMVTTIHGFSGAGILPAYLRSRSSFVAISASDRCAGLDYAATIHHGIDISAFRTVRVWRLSGLAQGASIRTRASRRLSRSPGGQAAAGDLRHRAGPAVLHRPAEPHVDGDQVVFHGPVGPQRRAEILGGAAALLHPIGFDEPFGLSVVEAMACGTPVVAYRRGSMAEIIDEGLTGYLAHDVSSSARAVLAAVRLDRGAVRARAAARFGSDRMIDDYLRTYERLLRPARTAASGAYATPMRESSIP